MLAQPDRTRAGRTLMLCDVYDVVYEMSRTHVLYLYSSVKPSSCLRRVNV
jgi:hypothetical protein